MPQTRQTAEQEQKAKIRVRKFGESWCVRWSCQKFSEGRWFRTWGNVVKHVSDELRVAVASSFDVGEQTELFHGPH